MARAVHKYSRYRILDAPVHLKFLSVNRCIWIHVQLKISFCIGELCASAVATKNSIWSNLNELLCRHLASVF